MALTNNNMETKRFDLPVAATEFQIENKSDVTRTKREGTVVRELAVATYDVTGGDSGTIAAHGLGVYIPTKAIITNAWVDVVTTFTSATDAATIALKVESANDLTAAIAISNASNVWDAGVHGCLPGSYAEATVAGDTAVLDAARKAASYIKTTAVREITATVAVEALTAGKMNVYLEYVLSD
jgi:hypothetical protein